MADRFHIRVCVERCKGCGLCVAACAKGLIRMSKKLGAKGHPVPEIVNEGDCGGCRQCADMCPEAGVEIDRITSQTSAPETAAHPSENKEHFACAGES